MSWLGRKIQIQAPNCRFTTVFVLVSFIDQVKLRNLAGSRYLRLVINLL